MNNEIVLAAALGITAGLIIAVVAAYRTQRTPGAGVLRRGGMLAMLVYAVIAAPVFVRGGMTLLGLVLLLVVLVLPMTGLLLDRRPGRPAPVRVETLARALVGTGLTAVMLIAAGQSLSLLSRLDPRTVVVVVAVIAALIAGGQGLAASSRVGSVAIWLMIVPILISLALGLLLGRPAQAAAPIVQTDGPAVAHILAVGVAAFVLGWADHGLAALGVAGGFASQRRALLRVLAGALGVVALIALGQLMFLGGSVLAPSMQFFVVPANIDAVPALAAALLAIVTTLFAALVCSTLTGVGALGGDRDSGSARWVAAGAVLAAAVALADPGSGAVLVVTTLAAAAVLGARLAGGDVGRGVTVGLVLGAAATVVLAATGQLDLGWAAVAAITVVALAALIAGRSAAATAAAVPPQPHSVAD